MPSPALVDPVPEIPSRPPRPRSIAIALLGAGGIGSALARRLDRDDHPPARVVRALVRDTEKPRDATFPPGCLTTDAEAVLAPRPDVVVELLGGVEPAATLVARALSSGIPVVTANKSMLAARGGELAALAARAGVPLLYEAAVLAGVPFLGALASRANAAAISRIEGIVNGTCNVLIGALAEGTPRQAALADATRRGLAEPRPDNDLHGVDAAEKLAVLLRHLRRIDGVENAIVFTTPHGTVVHGGPGAGPDATAGAPDCGRPAELVVTKVGGSVFTAPAAYRTVARALAARLHGNPAVQLVVVVSAEHGATDALLRTARDLADEPDPRVVDLLWSTGELRATALLTLALQSAGVRATAANIHQAGLVSTAGLTRVRPLRLRALLAAHDIVVAPGFLARAEGDAVVSLGRGGSDLTAVLLAAGLGAGRCELIKDVPGYFTADPSRTPSARHLPAMDYDAALALADQGCPLVQRQAIVAARDAGLPLVVRAFTDPRFTSISSSVS